MLPPTMLDPLVEYKIVDSHNYLLMTIDGKLLRGLFEHERLKPAMIRTDKGNVSTLSALTWKYPPKLTHVMESSTAER